MHQSLLRNIMQGAMLMEPIYAQAFYPVLESIITGKLLQTATSEDQLPGIHYASTNSRGKISNGSSSKEKRIAVIPLKGAVIKYDEPCGAYGTESLASWIRSANNDPAIDAIVLDVDSGGGMGDAVQNPSAAIQESGKPVIGWAGNGMAASACYWILSNCDEIYATYDSDEIGSIGTYVTLANWKKHYLEKYKLEIKELYASKSTEKNRLFINAIESAEGEEALIKNYIDPFNEDFISAVKANRPGVDEAVFAGGLFRATEAQEKGLIDGIKTFEEVLQRAAELAP